MGRPAKRKPSKRTRSKRLATPARGTAGRSDGGAKVSVEGRPDLKRGITLDALERAYASISHDEPNIVVTRDVKAAETLRSMYPDALAGPLNLSAHLREAYDKYQRSRRRTRTILLLEGINDRTNRPIRVYIKPDDTLVTVETVGLLYEAGVDQPQPCARRET